jgi:hypothetical protein
VLFFYDLWQLIRGGYQPLQRRLLRGGAAAACGTLQTATAEVRLATRRAVACPAYDGIDISGKRQPLCEPDKPTTTSSCPRPKLPGRAQDAPAVVDDIRRAARRLAENWTSMKASCG